MGNSFGNVQVHVGDRSIAEVRAEILDVYRRSMAAEGYALVDDDGYSAADERIIYLSRDRFSRWIAVYDERIDCVGEPEHRAVARMLSDATKQATLGIWVQSSDVLELYLYRNGEPIDSYSSDPENAYVIRNLRQQQAYHGHEELWRDLLVGAATPGDLRIIWDAPTLIRQMMLRSLAPLFGEVPGWGECGWRDRRWEAPAFAAKLQKLVYRPVIGERQGRVNADPFKIALAAETAWHEPYYPYLTLAQAGYQWFGDGVAASSGWIARTDPDDGGTANAPIEPALKLLSHCQRYVDERGDLPTNVAFSGTEYGDMRSMVKFTVLRVTHDETRLLVDDRAYEYLVGEHDVLIAVILANRVAVLIVRNRLVMALLWAAHNAANIAPLVRALPIIATED